MPPEADSCELIARQASGTLTEQRAALAALMVDAGWPEPTREDSGRPRIGDGFCSLSHGGSWVVAVRGDRPVGVDVEGATERLRKVRARFVGPADQPVLEPFGDTLDTLCRLWTAKEAVFKAFGTGVDFLTGIEWTQVSDDGARLIAVQHDVELILRWEALDGPEATTWMALAVAMPEHQARKKAPCGTPF